MADKIRLLVVGAAIALTWVYGSQMSYTDYLWAKFGVTVGLAAVYGFWCGLTGRKM